MASKPRLSVQLYSLRHLPDLDDQLRLVREAGLDHVETTSGNYEEAARLRTLLDRYGLRAPSGHVGIERLREAFDETVAIAGRLGTDTLILWGFPDEERPRSAAGWRQAGADLGRLAERLAARHIVFAFHNHDWELERFEEGGLGFDHLMAGAGEAPLKWQADLAWLARGGADIDAILARHEDRLVSVHVKDLAPPGENRDEDGWADLGQGILPWSAWWPRLRALQVDLLVLEHDEPSDPARFLRRSAEAARSLLRSPS